MNQPEFPQNSEIKIGDDFLWDHEHPGRLIVFCGFDGSGKTTQISMLSDRLSESEIPTLVTKQPTDSYRTNLLVQKYLRQGGDSDAASKLMSLAAEDRKSHIANIILPALREGYYVICDRYVFSTIALFLSRGVSLDEILESNKPILKPNYCFYLNVESTQLFERITKRDGGNKQFEERSISSISRILLYYSALREYFTLIDGEQDIEKISNQIISMIEI